MLVYLIMMFGSLLALLLFAFPCKYTDLTAYLDSIFESDISIWASLLCITLFTLTFFFFTLAAYKDPGYIRNDGVNFMDLLNVCESTQLCAECETIRTTRSRHCSVCGCCVERFDHHCPWINNCVGLKNHNVFLAYLTFQLLAILTTLTESIYALLANISLKTQFH